MRRLVLVAFLLGAFGLGSTALGGGDLEAECVVRDLAGTFRLVPGSAGAGGISYELRLRNRSTLRCALRLPPIVALLDANGNGLPTRALGRTAGAFLLGAGRTAVSTVRFSPTVPGPGEPTDAPCQPVAHRLLLAKPPDALVVKVSPPTRVCVHGRMRFSAFALA